MPWYLGIYTFSKNLYLLKLCFNFSTYPLTPPIYSARGYMKYRIGIISDLDTTSKHPTNANSWISYIRKVFYYFYF